MTIKAILKNQVQNYMLDNPINDFDKNKYSNVCKKFNIDIKLASKYWIELKSKNSWLQNIKNQLSGDFQKIPDVNFSPREVNKILKQEGNILDVTLNKVDFEIKTLEDLLAVCQVDTSLWEVISWQCKKWDLGIKNLENKIETKELYSVSAKFKAIKIENNLNLQKDIILKELYEKAPKHDLINSYDYFTQSLREYSPYDKKCLFEIALFDVHFGKLAHKEEVGEDYDLKIAKQRYKTAVKELINSVNIKDIGRILLPIGQDLINIDNLKSTTTFGTPQDCDSRFHKIVKTVKNLLIETINELIAIAPVDVVITVGNHDEQTTFMIGEMLDAYYTNCSLVNVYNENTLRKYYQYGTTSIMFTHGNREKFNELGMIFAAENPKLWADTTQRYIQIGHFHHNKLMVLQKQEFQGFQIQILPSLSGTDAWHKGKGYQSLKQAKGFLFDYEKGLIGEFSHTV